MKRHPGPLPRTPATAMVFARTLPTGRANNEIPSTPFAVTTLFVTVLLSNPLSADPVGDFYKGKQIRIITGAAAGDGYDLWSRMLARHMGRHIPGRPSIIVQNMPGAGTVVAANYVFNVAAKDGSVIGSFSRSLPSQALIGRPNIQFDPRRFGWIGSPESINRVCAVGKAAKAQSIDDLFKHELVVGRTTRRGDGQLLSRTSLHSLNGARLRVL